MIKAKKKKKMGSHEKIEGGIPVLTVLCYCHCKSLKHVFQKIFVHSHLHTHTGSYSRLGILTIVGESTEVRAGVEPSPRCSRWTEKLYYSANKPETHWVSSPLMNSLDILAFCWCWSELQGGNRVTLGSKMQTLEWATSINESFTMQLNKGFRWEPCTCRGKFI